MADKPSMPAMPLRAPKNAPKAKTEVVEVSAIPIGVAGPQKFDEIVNYKASDESGSEMLGARCPIQWASAVDEIVANRKVPFARRSDFVRWSIRMGMTQAAQYIGSLEQQAEGADMTNSELDSTTRAFEFTERIGGLTNARTSMIKKLQTQIRGVSEAVKVCMDIGEIAEAVKLVMFYVDNVDELKMTGFWRTMAFHSLYQDIELKEALGALIMAGEINHEALIEAAVVSGAIRNNPHHTTDHHKLEAI